MCCTLSIVEFVVQENQKCGCKNDGVDFEMNSQTKSDIIQREVMRCRK